MTTAGGSRRYPRRKARTDERDHDPDPGPARPARAGLVPGDARLHRPARAGEVLGGGDRLRAGGARGVHPRPAPPGPDHRRRHRAGGRRAALPHRGRDPPGRRRPGRGAALGQPAAVHEGAGGQDGEEPAAPRPEGRPRPARGRGAAAAVARRQGAERARRPRGPVDRHGRPGRQRVLRERALSARPRSSSARIRVRSDVRAEPGRRVRLHRGQVAEGVARRVRVERAVRDQAVDPRVGRADGVPGEHLADVDERRPGLAGLLRDDAGEHVPGLVQQGPPGQGQRRHGGAVGRQLDQVRVAEDQQLGVRGLGPDLRVHAVQPGRQHRGRHLLRRGDGPGALLVGALDAGADAGGEADVVAADGDRHQGGAALQGRELVREDVRGGGAAAGLERERAGPQRLRQQRGVGVVAAQAGRVEVRARPDAGRVRVTQRDVRAGPRRRLGRGPRR